MQDADTRGMSKKRIMLVDDDPMTLTILSKIMTSQDYQVLPCENGLMAVGEAMRSKPDVMVLDLMMPSPDPQRCEVFDGFSVLRWLQRSSNLMKVPVIVLSSKPVSEAKETSLNAGAVAYFQKPCDRQALLTAVAIALESPRNTSSGSAALSSPTPAQDPLTCEEPRDADRTQFETRAELRRINRALEIA